MDNRLGSGIQSQMIWRFGVLLVAVVLTSEVVRYYGVPFAGIKGEQAVVREDAFKKFSVLADIQKDRIGRWVEEAKERLGVVAVAPSFRAAFASGERRQMEQALAVWKNTYPSYRDLMVVDRATGTVLVSTEPARVGTRLLTGNLDDRMVGADGFLADVVASHAVKNKYELLFATPIRTAAQENAGERAKEMLVGAMDMEGFLTPVVRAARGLGDTGEIVLVNQDRKLLMPLLHDLEDGTRAVPMVFTNNAAPAVRAARGEEGIVEARDYRGVPVLAACRYIALSPHKGWGMVVKCDLSEVFASVRRSRQYVAVVVVLGLLAGLGVIVFFARRVSRPLRKLEEAARRVQENDFTVRVDAALRNEVGVLAHTFNRMVERIAGWTRELEAQVARRTEELRATNQQLRANEQQLRAANQQLRANEQQLRAANQQLRANEQQLRASNEQLRANEQQLRAEMAQRARVEEETQRHLNELQIFFKASVGREERIIELKERIEKMEADHRKRGDSDGHA